MQKLIGLCVALAFTSIGAYGQVKPSQCSENFDPSGCLLELAKNNASKIRDSNKQAESLAAILSTHAQLKRTDFDLLSKSQKLASHPKLEMARYLELQTALAAYFQNVDPLQAKRHSDLAAQVFFKAIEKDQSSDRIDLAIWSCDLIDGHSGNWREIAFITAATCTPERMSRIEGKGFYDQLLRSFLTMNAAWIQSDYETFNSAKDEHHRLIEAVEAEGIRKKDKAINIATQAAKVAVLTSETEIYRRSNLPNLYQKAWAQAREALTGLEKLTSGVEAVSARIQLAEQYNASNDFNEALAFLEPIADRFEGKGKVDRLPEEVHVEYLTALARAKDLGGFKSYSDAKLARAELKKRKADVLYERYLYISRSDKNKGKASPQSLGQLRLAAEAGHPIAMHNFALLFANGDLGVPKDQQKALFWYAWAAQAGLAGAQNNLGDMYEKGTGTPVDLGMAVYWYTQAAMQGEPTAYLSLGELFLEGKGVPQNDVTAAVWLNLAVAGLPKGQNQSTAVKLRDQAVERLDDDSRELVVSRVRNFVPLRQTDSRLGDKPKKGEEL